MKNKIDPRVLFLFVFLLSTAAVVLREPLPLTPILLSAVVAAICLRAPFAQLLKRLRGLWIMLLSVIVLQSLFGVGGIVNGLLVGAAVLERLLILMLGSALLAGYPGHALVQGMLQLHIPYQIAYMVSIALRFLPQFSESFKDSLTAMQLRGVDLRRLKWRIRMRIYTYLLMPTIVQGVDNARKLAMAMELRGFGAYDKRSAYAPLHMRRSDWLAFSAVILWAGIILSGEVLWRVYG